MRKWVEMTVFCLFSFESVSYIEVKLTYNSNRMSIVVLCCSGARISVRYGSLNAIFAKIAQARLKVDPVINE